MKEFAMSSANYQDLSINTNLNLPAQSFVASFRRRRRSFRLRTCDSSRHRAVEEYPLEADFCDVNSLIFLYDHFTL